jgi:valyl-tRNA synthetase
MSSTLAPDSLPNRFDHAEAQPRLYAAWEQGKFFHARPDPSKKPFSIVIPPPNVTGALHLGHALNNTLQDIQIRMHRMRGFNALWMPGTDHAGIATQAVVERRLKEEENKTRHDLGREKLVERIWAWKEQYEARILGQLKNMGCSCDWDRTRFTLDEVCARAVRRTFFDLFQKGLIYRGKRLVNWDTFLQTAVSDDEVFQETVKGKFYHFRYPVLNPQPGEPTHVEIATTRPETMLGDTAVAVHPEPAQALDAVEAELRERLAKAPAKEKEALQQQIENIQQRRTEMLPLLETLAAMAKAGRKLRLPLANRGIPLIADIWAKPELGTGAVKITPAHDPNDYEVWQRNKHIGLVNILNPDGTLNANAGGYEGMKMLKARERVVADLDALGLLGDIEDRDIELPHSDRSKTPIEPYLADQWFVRMGDVDGKPGLAQTAMDAVIKSNVKIFPERYAKSYLDWLGEKRDWPVSRQLWWGHQIPVWSKRFTDYSVYRGLGMATAEAAMFDELSDRLWSLQEHLRASVYFVDEQDSTGAFSPTPPSSGPFTAYVCVADETNEHPEVYQDNIVALMERLGFTRDPDVLDTWFSSALWPHSTLGWPEKTPELDYFYPTSTLITSRDIITLWVARMVIMGLNNVGEIPFREVFIHPKILDGYGETMSKSKGNGVDPLDIVDKFGADALRFGLAMLTTETQDVRMPVQFECPHCQTLIDQTKKNRELPRVKCDKCGGEFSTQWARTDADKSLPRGAVVSERFEVARNFTSKLWNASRFALINLKEYTPGAVAVADLTVEDRWILSRLATVTREVTAAIEAYHYADAAKSLYDFAWDEFCSFYIEMAKPRLQDEATRAHAQRVLAHVLDGLLRLLHPMMPFVTEEVWQLLNQMAPQRGVPEPAQANDWIITAAWPAADAAHIDPVIETRFRIFQQALGALREIRSRQNISMKQPIEFVVRCDDETAQLLSPMQPYFDAMANAKALQLGPAITPPKTHAKTALAGMELYVDLKDFIDVKAEIAKNEKLEQQLLGLIKGKESKLSNESFVAKAPANVVETERAALAQAQEQLLGVRATLSDLRAS